MIDVALIKVKAGRGGDGRVSFRREKFVPKGGPDGGDGGDGGSVYLVGERNLRTLDYFAGRQKFEAASGGGGGVQKRSGAKADDVYVKVPQGCVVYEIDGINDMQISKNDLYALLRGNKEQLEVIHRGGDKSNRMANNEWRITRVGEVLESGQELVVARGGKGGRGNTAFKGPSNTTPREAESGSPGESRWLVLELKLLADVGLIGLPNAGKSTLLSVLTAARPKIADYPFTTLEPNLGVLRVKSNKLKSNLHNEELGAEGITGRRDGKVLSSSGKTLRQSDASHLTRSAQGGDEGRKSMPTSSRELVLADIPGLIEGAARGRGLGDEFLRHVERCGVLVHVVALRLAVGNQLSVISQQIVEDYRTVREELEKYHPELAEKPEVVVVNKMDLVESKIGKEISKKLREEFGKMGVEEVLFVSAVIQEGLEELVGVLIRG